MKRDELAALGYQVIDASNPVVEVAWIVRCPSMSDRVFVAASEDEGWSIAEKHHADTPGTLEERLREAAANEVVYATQQDFYHAEILTEAADEIASLRARVEAKDRALTLIAERAEELKAGTDDWFEMVEFSMLARQALKDTPDAE